MKKELTPEEKMFKAIKHFSRTTKINQDGYILDAWKNAYDDVKKTAILYAKSVKKIKP
jgi:hypothetical protein